LPIATEPLAADSLEVSLTVSDVRRSTDWYRDTLGFTVDRQHEREGRLIAVSLSAGSIRVLLSQDNGAKGSERVKGEGFSIQITTPQDIDGLAGRAKQAGAVLDTEPIDAYGARVFRLRDPDGFRLVVSSPRKG
jgi:catechol 2,3-dioxygenase-like lactoylglutathione lyase family enzyme